MRSSTLEYLALTMRHKWFVFLAGLRLGVPILQLVLHDWSKLFLASAYGAVFFTQKRYREAEDYERFNRAWLYHQNHEPHHWEYWIPRTPHDKGNGVETRIKIPERYVREMVADWLAAERTYNGRWPESPKTWGWFKKNRGRILVHPETAVLIDCLLMAWFEGEDLRRCRYKEGK